MLQPSAATAIYFAIQIIDFRKGIDGLVALCNYQLKIDPFSGAFFLFRCRNRKSIKILAYDGQGFWLMTKRLSKDKFQWWPESTNDCVNIPLQELQILLWNGDPTEANFAKPWKSLFS